MGQQEVITRKKVQQAAEVAAQSECLSARPALGLPKREVSRAVAMVVMRAASLQSGAPVLTRHVPVAAAVVGELGNPSRTYSQAMTAVAVTMAVVGVVGPRTAEMAATEDSVAAVALDGLVYWVALTAAMEVSEVAGVERQTGALLDPRTQAMGEYLEETEIHALVAVAPAWAAQFLMTAAASW
jgi:hypothetical protein